MPASHGSHRFFSFGGVTFLRATGLFKHPVYLGEIGALGALLMTVPLLGARQTLRGRRASMLLWAILFGAMIASFSRASWLGFLVAALLMPPMLFPRRAVRYLILLSVLGGVFVLSGGMVAILDYMVEVKSSSVDYRLEIMKLGLRAFLEEPWFGTGLGAFLRYPGNVEGLHVHNSFMMALTETGLLGGVAFFLLYVRALERAIRNLFLACEPDDKNLAVVLFLALILITIMQQFEQAVNFHMNYFLLGTIEAMTPYLRAKLGAQPERELRRADILRLLPRKRWA